MILPCVAHFLESSAHKWLMMSPGAMHGLGRGAYAAGLGTQRLAMAGPMDGKAYARSFYMCQVCLTPTYKFKQDTLWWQHDGSDKAKGLTWKVSQHLQ